MRKELRIELSALLLSLARAVDLVSPMLAGHHLRVAFIALGICTELGLNPEERVDIGFAAAMHDVGAFSLRERLDALHFELEEPHEHAHIGYTLVASLPFFSRAARLIKHHHVAWEEGRGEEFMGEKVSLGSHILHLADRVEVLIDKGRHILRQRDEICETVKEASGKKFHPRLVEAFLSAARREAFWLDLSSGAYSDVVSEALKVKPVFLDLDGLLQLGELYSAIVDFRSPFTAAHSKGVAATAEILARFAGFSDTECNLMRLAGYLHDLGKLAISKEILEKPSDLTPDERSVIKSHAYYTYRCLEPIVGLETVNLWASLHHERSDGTGYPFCLTASELPLGSRIVAVADVFTALTEDRPYRKGLPVETALEIVSKMAKEGALDPDLISLLRSRSDQFISLRRTVEKEALQKYQTLREESKV